LEFERFDFPLITRTLHPESKVQILMFPLFDFPDGTIVIDAEAWNS